METKELLTEEARKRLAIYEKDLEKLKRNRSFHERTRQLLINNLQANIMMFKLALAPDFEEKVASYVPVVTDTIQ